MSLAPVSLLLAGLVLAVPSVCYTACQQGENMRLSDYVPAEIEGRQPSEPDGLYKNEEIYRYMNGAGEVYMSYDFRELFVRQFAKEGMEAITVELFDMGSSADAFGVFTRGRGGGADAGIGQDSEYQTGHLMFWKDKYFASVYIIEETEETRRVILDLGKSIADAIPAEGDLPKLLTLLPRENRVAGSVSFFHKHTCLNYHYFLSDENILNLGGETNAAMALYESAGEKDRFLIIQYPDGGQAEAAYNSFLENYLPEGKSTGIARLENGRWTAASVRGEFLFLVFDAAGENRARDLSATAQMNLEEKEHE